MKNLNFYFCVVCLTINFQSFCQEQKTYKSMNGKIVYQYYENQELERIFNGSYTEYYSNLTSIKGNFKENFKEGFWEYSRRENYIYDREYFGNYKKDKKNGKWFIKTHFNIYTKKFKYLWQLEFKNDTIVGEIDFTKYKEDVLNGFKGKIDSLGNFTGIWQTEKKLDYENIIEFHKGFLIKHIERNLVTGKIIQKYVPQRDSIIKKINELLLIKNSLKKAENNYLGSKHTENLYGYELDESLGGTLLQGLFSVINPPTTTEQFPSIIKNIRNVDYYYNSPKKLMYRNTTNDYFKIYE